MKSKVFFRFFDVFKGSQGGAQSKDMRVSPGFYDGFWGDGGTTGGILSKQNTEQRTENTENREHRTQNREHNGLELTDLVPTAVCPWQAGAGGYANIKYVKQFRRRSN